MRTDEHHQQINILENDLRNKKFIQSFIDNHNLRSSRVKKIEALFLIKLKDNE